MPHMTLHVTAEKYTTRDGSHNDDFEYLKQVKETIEIQLAELGFIRNNVRVEFAP